MIYLIFNKVIPQEIISTIQSSESCIENITIPVTVQYCYGVGAISMIIEYDQSMLSYSGYQNKHPLLSGFFYVNEDDGLIILSWASINTISIGNGTLIEYNFSAIGGVSQLQFDTLTSGNCEFSNGDGDSMPAIFFNGQSSVSQGLFVSAGDDITINCGEMLTIDAMFDGGIPPYSLQWSTGQEGQAIDLVPYENIGVEVNVVDSIGCTATDNIYITVVPASNQQSITLQNGWNGVSSYINPTDPSIETILFNHANSFMVLVDPYGNLFYPGEDINTIVNWDNQSGYSIKTNQQIEVVFYGELFQDKSVSLNEGWNIIPGLSECDVSVVDLLAGISNNVIKEVGGSGVFWPEKDVYSLEYLHSGSAYYLYTDTPFTLTFPDCPK